VIETAVNLDRHSTVLTYTVLTLQRIRRTVVQQMNNAVHQHLQVMKIASVCDVILPSCLRMETVAFSEALVPLYNTEQESQMRVCLTVVFFVAIWAFVTEWLVPDASGQRGSLIFKG